MAQPDPDSTLAIASGAYNALNGYGLLVSGTIGGVISLRFVAGMTAWQRISGVAAGCVMAHYLSPIIAALFEIEPHTKAIAFLVGLFGLSVCGAIFDSIKHMDLWGLIQSRYGKE